MGLADTFAQTQQSLGESVSLGGQNYSITGGSGGLTAAPITPSTIADTGLTIASAIPGPQQPIVVAGKMIWDVVQGIISKSGKPDNPSAAGGSRSAATAAANWKSDITANTQHAVNFFNNAYDMFKTYLSESEWNALATVEIPKVQADPYYGGLGNSYTSPYAVDVGVGSTTWATVPGIGIAQDIDAYISTKLSSGQTAGTDAQAGLAQTIADLSQKLAGSNQASDVINSGGSNIMIFAAIGLIVLFVILKFRK